MVKARADNVDVACEIAKNSLRKHTPPEHVTLLPCHMPFWDDIIAVRNEWNKLDLIIAANLARTLYDIETYSSLLQIQGPTVMGGKHGKTAVVNPIFNSLESATRRATTLAQKLQVHAQATMGDPRKSRVKNKSKQDFAQAFEDDDEGLIAKPH